MCGIIGHVGESETADVLLTGLDNLEYRGYDSAGYALKAGHELEVHKREGEVGALKRATQGTTKTGELGIGHTRWSTHGTPTDSNAHPHTDCHDRVAVVHNGIIDNYDTLRDRLQSAGHEFTSETDTEVIPHLVESYLPSDGLTRDTVKSAFKRAVDELEGSYAIAMIVAGIDAIFATRVGSPLVLGVGADGYFLASDIPAFLEYTENVLYLEDGEMITVTPSGYRLTNGVDEHIDRAVETVDWTPEDAEKEGFDHYMLKEIYEQPAALERTIEGRVFAKESSEPTSSDGGTKLVTEELSSSLVDGVTSVQFVACGTSYHAAMYGEQLLKNRGIEASSALASEFAATDPPLSEGTLVVGVTQSGETADTLEALRTARRRGHATLAITNVIGSTAARECDDALFIRAGPEIGVAATKTFSSQVATLALFAAHLADDPGALQAVQNSLANIPGQIQSVLDNEHVKNLARRYRDSDSYFFTGRATAHPVALEGALKLKEISYEHAEGFPAGELKHGPLALVTEHTPVFAIITGEHTDKMRGTIREVSARGAPVIAVCDRETTPEGINDRLPIPKTDPELAGILANVQLQLFSYYTATLLDRPVDKPRNLAKSVTVE